MNVNVAIGHENASGMFFHAPYDPASPNTMPTTGAAVLALVGETSPWKIAGVISEDGPSWTPYGSTEAIRLWDLTTARTVETEKGTMTIPVISTDGESMKTVFGGDAFLRASEKRFVLPNTRKGLGDHIAAEEKKFLGLF
jgi:hypothetical protein